MPSVRVDLIVVFAAALLTIFVVKLTSLLPTSLYFNFSSSFSDDIGAFLVPRPVLEASQQCELARARGFRFKSCPSGPYEDPPMSARERDLLVQAVIEAQAVFFERPEVVSEYRERRTDPAGDITSDLQWRDNLADFRNKRPVTIASSLLYPLLQDVEGRVDAALEPDPEAERELEDDEDSDQAEASSAAVAAMLAEAEDRALDDMHAQGALSTLKLTPAEVVRIATENPTRWAAIRAVGDRLDTRFAAGFAPIYETRLLASGIDIDAMASGIERSVVAQTGWQYALALAIRLMVPVLAGVLLALLLGADARISIATGGAFAAFLLAWPIALLWDGVVEQQYQHLRMLFIGFYLAYVLSFFTLAWLGATLGAMAGMALRIRGLRIADDAPRLQSAGRLAKEVPFQVLLNVVTNGITLAFSFMVFGSDVGYV